MDVPLCEHGVSSTPNGSHTFASSMQTSYAVYDWPDSWMQHMYVPKINCTRNGISNRLENIEIKTLRTHRHEFSIDFPQLIVFCTCWLNKDHFEVVIELSAAVVDTIAVAHVPWKYDVIRMLFIHTHDDRTMCTHNRRPSWAIASTTLSNTLQFIHLRMFSFRIRCVARHSI